MERFKTAANKWISITKWDNLPTTQSADRDKYLPKVAEAAERLKDTYNALDAASREEAWEWFNAEMEAAL